MLCSSPGARCVGTVGEVHGLRGFESSVFYLVARSPHKLHRGIAATDATAPSVATPSPVEVPALRLKTRHMASIDAADKQQASWAAARRAWTNVEALDTDAGERADRHDKSKLGSAWGGV